MATRTKEIVLHFGGHEDILVDLSDIPLATLQRAVEQEEAWIKRPLRKVLHEHIKGTDDWINDGYIMPDLEPLKETLRLAIAHIERVQRKHPGKFHNVPPHVYRSKRQRQARKRAQPQTV